MHSHHDRAADGDNWTWAAFAVLQLILSKGTWGRLNEARESETAAHIHIIHFTPTCRSESVARNDFKLPAASFYLSGEISGSGIRGPSFPLKQRKIWKLPITSISSESAHLYVQERNSEDNCYNYETSTSKTFKVVQSLHVIVISHSRGREKKRPEILLCLKR